MTEASGEVYPRIEVKTANQVMDILAQYHVATLPVISCPALVAVATLPEEMAAIRNEGLADLATRMPQLEVAHMDGAGHELLIDNPQAVSDFVWAFLSRWGSKSGQD